VNVLKPHRKSTVFTLISQDVSQREIHRLTGIDRKTIRFYAKMLPTEAAGGDSNSSTPATGPVGAPEVENPPPWPPAISRQMEPKRIPKLARSACEAHREWIEAQVRLGRNAMAIYQELVDTCGFTHAYNSVKRFCRALRRQEPEQFDRLEFSPAEECQVDYGEGAPTRHPVSGKYRKPRLFVMTLCYSRRSFRQVVWKSSTETWARLHEQAFRYFSGSTKYVCLDNLKEGVLKPDIYEPELNPVYAAMLAHYICFADPARVRDPDRKGRVENAIQHTQSTALKGMKALGRSRMPACPTSTSGKALDEGAVGDHILDPIGIDRRQYRGRIQLGDLSGLQHEIRGSQIVFQLARFGRSHNDA